jgi:hypothetical protein
VRAAGHGALKIVSEITGLARSTINRGEDDLDEGPLPDGRMRRRAAARNRSVSETRRWSAICIGTPSPRRWAIRCVP